MKAAFDYSANTGKQVFITKTNGEESFGKLLGLCEDGTFILEINTRYGWGISEVNMDDVQKMSLN